MGAKRSDASNVVALPAPRNPNRPDTRKGHVTPPKLKAPPGAPATPTMLKGDALREWKRVVPALDALGILSVLDRSVLVAYCTMWARWCELDRRLTKEGLVVKDANGCVRKNPAWQMYRESGVQVASLAATCGLTPASRLKLPAPDGGQVDADAILD